jgi:hypothetical protein
LTKSSVGETSVTARTLARERLLGLAGASFSLVYVLGGFSELRDGGDLFLIAFYAAVWIASVHAVFPVSSGSPGRGA